MTSNEESIAIDIKDSHSRNEGSVDAETKDVSYAGNVLMENNECYGTRNEDSVVVAPEDTDYSTIAAVTEDIHAYPSGELEHVQIENNKCYGTRNEENVTVGTEEAYYASVALITEDTIQVDNNESYGVLLLYSSSFLLLLSFLLLISYFIGIK